MTETEHTGQTALAEGTDGTPIPPPLSGLDAEQFLAELVSLSITEVDSKLKALLAEHGGEALPVMNTVIKKSPLPLAQKAMDQLVALRSQEAADTLAAIGADRSDAQKAKEARRALHKLSLVGIKPAVVAAPVRPEPTPDKIYACMASPIDREGTRSITIVRQNRFGTLRLAVFVLNENLGIVDALGADPCSMSMWRRYLDDANSREAKMVAVELAFCQEQIEIASRRNERSKTPLPDRYYMFYSIAAGQSEERTRPIELNPDAIRADADLLAKSADLMDLPECKSWLFDLDTMRSHALRMIAEIRRQQRIEKERDTELSVVDFGLLQREGTVVSVTMNELFDGARRSLFKERLEYTADIFWRSDRLEQARWAMAAALALAPESTLPVDQHPFLRRLTLQSLDVAVQAEQHGLTEEELAQGDAPKKVEAAQPEEYVDSEGLIRRKSGLILPR